MPVFMTDVLQAVKKYRTKQAVLFDMDGLIFDSERLFMEQLAVVMQEYGYQLTREIYGETLGACGDYLIQLMQSHYGKEYPFHEISREADRRTQIIADRVGMTIKPGIRRVLEYLRSISLPCAVVTSTKSRTAEKHLQHAGLRPFFQEIIGGEMVERSKPEPDIFLLACQKMGKLPEACVVLEDSENGVMAAHRAGCTVICIPDLKKPSEEVLQMAQIVVYRNEDAND